MLHHVLQFVGFVVAVLLAARVVPGIKVKSVGGVVVFALVLALLNKLVLPFVLVFTFPLILLTLGLGLILVNAFMWWLADKVVSGVQIDGYGAAIAASVVTTLINWGIHLLLRAVF
jgi:putative membrane protein